jgi:hypothetical protein
MLIAVLAQRFIARRLTPGAVKGWVPSSGMTGLPPLAEDRDRE